MFPCVLVLQRAESRTAIYPVPSRRRLSLQTRSAVQCHDIVFPCDMVLMEQHGTTIRCPGANALHCPFSARFTGSSISSIAALALFWPVKIAWNAPSIVFWRSSEMSFGSGLVYAIAAV